MNYDGWVAAVHREGEALAGAVRQDLSAPVPTCGSWDCARLAGHLGRVYRHAAQIVGQRLADSPASSRLPRPEGDVLAWYAESLELVLGVLRATHPYESAWNWSLHAQHNAMFWARRMAHESAVHRWDAQAAQGDPAPIESALATDGIEELFEVMLPRRQSRTPCAGLRGTLHLHSAEGGEWLARLTPEDCTVTRQHRTADVALRGTASQLLLVLYGRLAPIAIELNGSGELMDTWLHTVRF